MFISDPLHLGSLLLSQSHTRPELVVPSLGLACLDSLFFLSAIDSTHLDSSQILKPFSVGTNCINVGFQPSQHTQPLRFFGRTDFVVFLFGMSCLGLPLFSLDLANSDSGLLLRSFCRSEALVFAKDYLFSAIFLHSSIWKCSACS